MSSTAGPTAVVSGLNRHTVRIGKALSLCGILGTLEDVARPLGPLAGYAFVGTLTLLLVSFPLGRMMPSIREELSIIRWSATLLAVISAFLLLAEAKNPKITEQGVLATMIPAVAEIQKALISVDRHLGAVEANTKRTVEAIDRLQDTAKKESSKDPRKELANLGIKWDHASLINAQETRDVRTMDLLLAGGMRPKPGFGVLSLFAETQFSDEIAQLYLSYDVFQASDSCAPVDDYWIGAFYERVLNDSAKTKFVKEICGPKIKQALEAKLADQDARLNALRSFNANRSATIENCVSELGTKYTPPALYRSAVAEGVGSERDAKSAGELLNIKVRKEIVWRGYPLDMRMIASYIKDACNQYYSPKRDDAEAYRLDLLRTMRTKIVG